jgi:hypothetical protein
VQSVLAPSPELGPLPEDDDEDNDFIVDLDEILAAATHEEAAEQEEASSLKSADSSSPTWLQSLQHVAPSKWAACCMEVQATKVLVLCIQQCRWCSTMSCCGHSRCDRPGCAASTSSWRHSSSPVGQ